MHLRTYSLRLFPLLAVVILLCASARAQGPYTVTDSGQLVLRGDGWSQGVRVVVVR